MKHKRTKATDITKEVRQTVALRDKGKCIYCGKYVPVACSNAHFIKRSQGGLMENYLKGIYGEDWSKDKLVYKKY